MCLALRCHSLDTRSVYISLVSFSFVPFQMGNTVSAAEVVAANITHPTTLAPPPNHSTSGVPPPECPMHQKQAKPAETECPVHMIDNSDINPYNMVSDRAVNEMESVRSLNLTHFLFALRCHQETRIQHQINRFPCPKIDKYRAYQK